MDAELDAPANEPRSVFHRAWWLDAVAPSGWRRLGHPGAEALSLVAVQTGSALTPTLRAPLLTWNVGPGGSVPAFGDRLDRAAAAALETLLGTLPKDHQIVLPVAAPAEALIAIHAAGFDAHARVTYLVEPHADRIVSKNKRREVRQARARVEVRQLELAEALRVVESLTSQTFARQQLARPYSAARLAAVLSAADRHGCLDVRAAYSDGAPVAAGVFIDDTDESVYLLGGYADAAGGSGPMGVVLDTKIEATRDAGRRFNFEGSMQPGIATFFRSLGGQPRPYFVIERGGRSVHRLVRDVNRWRRHVTEQLATLRR